MRAVLVAALLLAGCGGARRGVPIVGPIAFSENAKVGQIAFMQNCNQCHPGGDAGVGPAINNKPIPHTVMTLQVRRGVLGSMPAFSEKEISENQLKQIFSYLDEMRKARSLASR
jgi:mono/diheme cytochrome c family protein